MSHFPFDLNAIDASLLTDAEKEWINSYHRDTFRIISGTGLLSDEELEWLRNKTTQIV
jgi:Xaa-Pro aminopeptidase